MHHDHYKHNKSDRCAPECDDQLVSVSRIGRGIKGDSFYVKISDPDTTNETYLEGLSYDEATKVWTSEWLSENINGGELSYQYNLRPFTIPQTFTMTFIYRRPGRPEWSWTTPAIPYLWDADGNGFPDVDGIVGSGCATLYIRESAESPWIEKLIYPPGTGPADFNTPEPLAPWSVNLTFGIGGDINIPNIDDISKIIGITVEQIYNILNDVPGALDGSDNVKDYIDDKDLELWQYIDDSVTNLGRQITEVANNLAWLQNYTQKALTDILNKIYGGGIIDDETGAITWPNTDKIAVGNMNLYSGPNTTTANHIMTDNSSDVANDLWVR